MQDFYLCGHGSWNVRGSGTVFVAVPGFTEVVFYKEIGDLLYLSEAEDILSGARSALEPARFARAYSTCPDMSLYPAPEFSGDFAAAAGRRGVEWADVSRHTHLRELVERHQGRRLHWIACSERGLRKTA